MSCRRRRSLRGFRPLPRRGPSGCAGRDPGRALDLLDLACTRSAREGRPRLARATLVDIVAERSGLPRERIDGALPADLLDLEAALARRVVGHDAALHTLAQLVRRSRAGFASQRPIASVLLLGPSGVGKTEIAKALAAALFDRADALVRLDMSEYAEPHAARESASPRVERARPKSPVKR